MDRESKNSKDALELKKSLSYANGYRELGMFSDALEELSQLPAKLAQRIEVDQMRLAILIDAQDWPAAECAAKNVALRAPDDPGSHINLAFVTRRSKSIEKAREILVNAAERFANTALIHYNIACYDCVEKNYEQSKERLVKAISLDPSFLNTAKEDEDLSDLGDWLNSLKVA